jgi:hypothetical protein
MLFALAASNVKSKSSLKFPAFASWRLDRLVDVGDVYDVSLAPAISAYFGTKPSAGLRELPVAGSGGAGFTYSPAFVPGDVGFYLIPGLCFKASVTGLGIHALLACNKSLPGGSPQPTACFDVSTRECRALSIARRSCRRNSAERSRGSLWLSSDQIRCCRFLL